MMCESPKAAASQHCPGPAAPALMLLGHEDWLLSTSAQKRLWEMTPSPSVLTVPLGCSQTHRKSTEPRFHSEQVPSWVCGWSSAWREPRPNCSEGTEDWPLIPELPHQTPPPASQSFLPSPQTSVLPNDSLNSQVIQNSRRMDAGQAGAFLLPTYHSLQHFTCFAFSKWEQTVRVLVLHTGWRKHEENNANCTHYLRVQGQPG